MKIKTTKSNIMAVLSKTESITKANSNSAKILSFVKITANEGQAYATLYATNLSSFMSIDFTASVLLGGGICIECEKLTRIIKEIADGDVEIICNTGSGVTIKSNEIQYRLNAVADVLDFPIFEEFPESSTKITNPLSLLSAISKCEHAVSTDMYKTSMNTIHIRKADAALTEATDENNTDTAVIVEATNGHRLAQSRALIDNSWLNTGILIPIASVKTLKNALSDSTNISIAVSETRIMIKSDRMISSIMLGASTFPDVDRIIPKSCTVDATIDRDSLLKAVMRVSILADDNYKGITLETSGKMLRVSSKGATGDAEAYVESTHNADFKIKVSSSYLMDVLKINKCNSIPIHITKDSNPIKIPINESIFLIMPMAV